MSSHLYHEQYLGYDIYIDPDEDPFHPREDYDNFGVLILFCDRDYYIGDKQYKARRDDAEVGFLNMDYDEEGNLVSLPLSIEQEATLGIVLPVYYRDYGSSGCRLWCGSAHGLEWDREGHQSGWIWASTRAIEKECGPLRTEAFDQAIKILQGEIETLEQYFNGEVYGYVVSQDEKELDSCWGFYGDYNKDCLSAARASVRALKGEKPGECQVQETAQITAACAGGLD